MRAGRSPEPAEGTHIADARTYENADPAALQKYFDF
jgi:hypothetical protein